MPIINIQVRKKIAVYTGEEKGVCDNSDYIVHFDFDEEWDDITFKTARFVYKNTFLETAFSGEDCPLPVLSDTEIVEIGVFSGNIKTTTSAYYPLRKSILSGCPKPAEPTPSTYDQIIEMLNGFSADVKKVDNKTTIQIVDPHGTTVAEVYDGEKGDKGDKGDTGAQGEKGEKGDPGSPGAVICSTKAEVLALPNGTYGEFIGNTRITPFTGGEKLYKGDVFLKEESAVTVLFNSLHRDNIVATTDEINELITNIPSQKSKLFLYAGTGYTLNDVTFKRGDVVRVTKGSTDINAVAVIFNTASGGSGGTTDHAQLTNRDANDQHPISAITGLPTALDSKANKDELSAYAKVEDVPSKTSQLENDSGFIKDISGKQDKLTAGENITIVDNVISASGGGGVSVSEEFELIEDITLTEEVNTITRTSEPDGTPYNFKSMAVSIYVPAHEVVDAKYYFYGSYISLAFKTLWSNTISTGQRYSSLVFKNIGQNLFELYEGSGGQWDYPSAGVALRYNFYPDNQGDEIRGFAYGANNSIKMLPVGTNIKIYGVRL